MYIALVIEESQAIVCARKRAGLEIIQVTSNSHRQVWRAVLRAHRRCDIRLTQDLGMTLGVVREVNAPAFLHQVDAPVPAAVAAVGGR